MKKIKKILYLPSAGQCAIIMFLVICLVSAGAQVAASTFESSLVSFMEKATEKYYKPTITVRVRNFTYANVNLPTAFTRVLEDELCNAISGMKTVAVQSNNLANALDPVYREKFDDFLKDSPPDSYLLGRFFEEGDSVRIHLELTDASTSLLLFSDDIIRPRTSIPEGISIRPEPVAARRAESLGHVLGTSDAHGAESGTGTAASSIPANQNNAHNETLRVSIATDRGKGGAYVEGENLEVFLNANKDAYVKIYHIDVNGYTKLIYPNRFDRGRKIRAGTVIRIPGTGYGFSFRLGAPYGTEFVKAVASTDPFLFTEADFADLGGDAGKIIGTGVQLAGRSQGSETAEALAGYYIGPR